MPPKAPAAIVPPVPVPAIAAPAGPAAAVIIVLIAICLTTGIIWSDNISVSGPALSCGSYIRYSPIP